MKTYPVNKAPLEVLDEAVAVAVQCLAAAEPDRLDGARHIHADLVATRETMAALIDELYKAHEIIVIALNRLQGEAKRKFVLQVEGAGLSGDGVTRFHERAAVLRRAGRVKA